MRLKLLIIITLFWGVGSSIAQMPQLYAPDSCYLDYTDYSTTEVNDPIIFFPESVESTSFTVDVIFHDGYSINWEKFTPGIGYQTVGTSPDFGFNPDTIAVGLRLTLTSATDTIVQRYWCLKNGFYANILTKDKDGNLSSGAYTSICDVYGPIQVQFNQADLLYFDPQTSDTLYYLPKYDMRWEKELDVSQGRMVDQGISGNIYRYSLRDAYWKDMYYYFIATDSCGTERRDTVYVRSINPHAGFTVTHVELTDSIYYPNESDEYYYFYSKKVNEDVSAPAMYMFINESENAHEYLWSFGDSVKLRTTNDTVVYTYELWGDYDVKLTAEHKVQWWTQTCTSDTTILGEDGVSIIQPKLMAPNVFSVNTASYLGTWRFTDVSISNFEIAIYARSGRRVHHFKGNIRDWNGWDGRVNKSSDYVRTGVYWYIVKDFTCLRNFDPDVESEFDAGTIWQGGASSGTNTNSGPSTVPSNSNSKSGKKRESTNSEYRGFIHVYNNN